MANIRLNQTTHIDYYGKMYFEKFGVADVKFTPRIVEIDGAKVVLLHIDGVNTNNGARVNVDLFPRYNCTLEFIDNLPKQFEDIMFRVGYYTQKDLTTGEEKVVEGQPKFLSYFRGGKEVFFDGDKHEYGDAWDNEPKATEEETEAEA